MQSYVRQSTIHSCNRTQTQTSVEGQLSWLTLILLIIVDINFRGFSENDIYRDTNDLNKTILCYLILYFCEHLISWIILPTTLLIIGIETKV